MKITVFRFYHIICSLVIFCFIFQISALKAHPHSWVSVLTEIEGDNKQITGLTMFWTFDLITTSDALSGQDLSEQARQNTLQLLAADMLANIKQNNYFSHFKQHYTTLAFKHPEQAKLSLEDSKLTLSFFLELDTPLSLPVHGLNLQVYEDTHYVDFLWLQQDDIQVSERFHGDCTLNILEPHYVATDISSQFSYDPLFISDAPQNNELGAISTQSATISCI